MLLVAYVRSKLENWWTIDERASSLFIDARGRGIESSGKDFLPVWPEPVATKISFYTRVTYSLSAIGKSSKLSFANLR